MSYEPSREQIERMAREIHEPWRASPPESEPWGENDEDNANAMRAIARAVLVEREARERQLVVKLKRAVNVLSYWNDARDLGLGGNLGIIDELNRALAAHAALDAPPPGEFKVCERPGKARPWAVRENVPNAPEFWATFKDKAEAEACAARLTALAREQGGAK